MYIYIYIYERSQTLTELCFIYTCQKFLCGGRVVFGHDAGSLFLTSFLIGGPAVTFCIKMTLKMINGDQPSFDLPVLIVAIVLTLLVGNLI